MLELQVQRTSYKNYGPDPRVVALVRSVEPHILEKVDRRNLIALAVVGSAARGEETWHDGKLVSDIDLAAVVSSPYPWTQKRIINKAADNLQEGMGLGCFPLYSLKRYRTVEFYEARKTAWVFWGKPDVFECVRLQKAGDIPKWESLRLLFNRAMECIRARANLLPSWYAAVKTYLALGEADLILNGGYEPSYQGRIEKLRTRGEILGSKEIFNMFDWATQVKLGMLEPPGQIKEFDHEGWLLEGLSRLLSSYLGEEVSIWRGLEIVAHNTVHYLHRAYDLLRHIKEPGRWNEILQRDPIFPVWERALQILSNQESMSESELKLLLAAWEATYQPLPT